jgi:hypothetical protein
MSGMARRIKYVESERCLGKGRKRVTSPERKRRQNNETNKQYKLISRPYKTSIDRSIAGSSESGDKERHRPRCHAMVASL